MKDLLSKYYSRTGLQTVYIDAMILNPRTKLVISEEESWSDIDVDEYKLASQRQFIEEYDRHSFIASASCDLDSRHDLNSSRRSNSTSIRPSAIFKSKWL